MENSEGLFSANSKPNDEIFGRSVSCPMTDTPAEYFIIKSEIVREMHFFMPSQNRLSLKERLS